MKLYAVIDKKAKAVVSFFTSYSDESATRSFLALITGADSVFTQFPEDFALFAFADLIVNGANLTVCRPGSDVLLDNGFKADSFHIFEPIKDGSDYDKRYLAMVHQDRVNYDILPDESPEEK